MSNPEKRRGIIKEISSILYQSAIVVGLIGFISKYFNLDKFAKIKN